MNRANGWSCLPCHRARWGRPVVRCLGLLLLALTCGHASTAQALGPNSAKVKKAIADGIKVIETADHPALGGKALIIITLLKNGAPKDHPKIEELIGQIKAHAAAPPEQIQWDIYSTGLAIIAMVAVDPSKYRPEIERVAKSLHLRQKEAGAWGYPAGENAIWCDTSQTQYAVLGLWEAQEFAGVETPPETWDRVAEWLMKCQAADGAFAYQGHPSEEIGKHIAQPGANANMTAAAMGPLYLVKDRLGIRRLKKSADDNTPTVMEPYESPEDMKARIKTKHDLRDFARAITMGNKWFERTVPLGKPKDWMVFYYLYARERYESLREADERVPGRKPRDDDYAPDWYHQGSAWLVENQQASGSWEGSAGEIPDTCFSLLFLLRSTQKTLDKAGLARHQAGLAVGGRGLPGAGELRLRDGAVVVKPLPGTLDEAMPALLDANHPQHAPALENLADLVRNGDREELLQRQKQLARLAVHGDSEAKMHAVAGIRRSRNLDLAPLLIHLLFDGDDRVARAASDALSQMSRKFTDYGLGYQPTAEQRAKAAGRWRQWYRGIRPDVDLDSYDPREAL